MENTEKNVLNAGVRLAILHLTIAQIAVIQRKIKLKTLLILKILLNIILI